MNDISITPSQMLDFVYCQRRWYLHTIENVDNSNHRLLVEGSFIHEEVDSGHISYGRNFVRLCGLCVYHNMYNIYGKCDEVLCYYDDNGVMVPFANKPVRIEVTEYKRGKVRDCLEYKVELMGQILCLENMYGCVIPYGYLYYVDDDVRVLVEADDELRKTAVAVIDSIRSQYCELTIKWKYGRKCRGCSVFRECNPKQILVQNYLNNVLWSE